MHENLPKWKATCPRCRHSFKKDDVRDPPPPSVCPVCRREGHKNPGVLNWVVVHTTPPPPFKPSGAADDVKPAKVLFDGPSTQITLDDIRDRIRALTDKQIVEEMQRDTYLNRARQKFSSSCARIENAHAQRTKPTAIDVRRMEFEAVLEIAAAFGVKL